MAQVIDDKSKHCVPFILNRLQIHKEQYCNTKAQPPFFVGLQGVQGAGKTTLVDTLRSVLTSPPHNLPTLVLSIDDLYLRHADQVTLAQSQAQNPLVQHRGEPSTHDIKLGADLFDALEQRKLNIKLPSYDKSLYNGAGDRTDEASWQTVNTENERPVEIIIFEGWCVGFRALSDQRLKQSWDAAREAFNHDSSYVGQLAKHELKHVQFVNDRLRAYDVLTDRFSCFIQIDAEVPLYVYDWRLEQEAALRRSRGAGMTDAQVVTFVNGYYPAYELYTQVLRDGIFSEKGRQLRLVVDKSRKVKDVYTL